MRLARDTGVREIGVIGCGALGLTSAILAQRAGLSVRIYAKELPPDVYSMRASGVWSPESRICDAAHGDAFGDRWEEMTRTSFRMYQSLLGLPGKPIEWIDGYSLSDMPWEETNTIVPDEPLYPNFHARVRDLTPHGVDLAPGTHPFPQAHARRYTTMMFNIATYARMLLAEFREAGGTIEVREFHEPRDLMKLRERTLINATGYGARALFRDESIVPGARPDGSADSAAGGQLRPLPREPQHGAAQRRPARPGAQRHRQLQQRRHDAEPRRVRSRRAAARRPLRPHAPGRVKAARSMR